MDQRHSYKFSSVGRALDPALTSNKAVLFLSPVAAVFGMVSAFYQGADFLTALQAAGVFALSVFGTWALARELLPDDQAGAFVSMAMGFLAAMAFSRPGLLVLFTTLLLVRVVNRSTGLAPRTSDSVVITGLVIWAVYSTHNPWFGAVGALAFFLDGVLIQPVKKQWLFALVCLGTMVVYMVDHEVSWWHMVSAHSLLEWLALLALFVFALNLILLKKVHSRGDADQNKLNLERVKAGMGIGILATLQGLAHMSEVILLVATIGGLCIGIAFRRAFRSPAKGLHSS